MNIPTTANRYPDDSRRLIESLSERILVLDGAMGTQIQDADPGPEVFGGAEFDGCNEYLNLTAPDLIRDIHSAYLSAGADILETNTFGSAPIVLEEYGLADQAEAISTAAARIARAAIESFGDTSKPRFVVGAIGPTTKSLSVSGGATYDELRDSYAVAIRGLMAGGVDALLFETSLDTLNVKSGFDAADLVFEERDQSLPIMVSITIEQFGAMLGGQDVEAALTSFLHRPLLSFGLNCSTGPDFMTDHLRTIATYSPFPTSCIPNAGLPEMVDGRLTYRLSPERLVEKLASFADHGWINLVGGCCGTTPEHIRSLVRAMDGRPPRVPDPPRRTVVSGTEAVEIAADSGPYFVGERTNSLGSRKFKRLIAEGKLDEAAEIGRRQVRAGAHILDVCLQNTDRDEPADLDAFLDVLVKKVRVPLMIDTTDEAVLARAVKRIQGKIIYNSVNLEDGEVRFECVSALARRYGMALVVGCIDEDQQSGMAVTRERKVQIAERSRDLLTRKYGVCEEDIIFDPLVFPCGTGDPTYAGSARETIEGVRLIKQRFPACKITLGVSNVSFGLPNAGREVLNSVFLHLCVEAGLDVPIVNTQKIMRYAQIAPDDMKLCMDLIDNVGDDPIAAFAAHFRGRKVREETADERSKLPIDERVAFNVVDGSKEGLFADLDTLLAARRPLAIINGPLMAGMDEVGRLFGANELIVAEVLQSAEVMKAAVAHLEPHMDRADVAVRGTMVLATVKGDVHDIGKGLVNIILSNNGYRVVDLGIKVLPDAIIAACREHRPDMIGLSGLLVKSAQQMVLTLEDLHAAGIDLPVLVGGAALSDRFTRSKIAPAYGGAPAIYARDAMSGLALAGRLRDPDSLEALWAERRQKLPEPAAPASTAAKPSQAVPILHDASPPVPPDLAEHVLDGHDLEEVFRYVNPTMLYGKHLGFKGNLARAIEKGDNKAIELKAQVESVFSQALEEGVCRPQAVFRFFAATGDGDVLTLYHRSPYDGKTDKDNHRAARFHFPRQSGDKQWCLSDFVRSHDADKAVTDHVAMFVVTCGAGVRERSQAWNAAGRFLDAHALQAIAIECAEGFAELLHEKLRSMWGIPDPPDMTLQQKFKAKYRGLRVSFGYPACPRLEDQAILFDALNVSSHIDLQLTEEYMMEPEASVSALVFHHPQARYFAIPDEDLRSFEARL